MLKNWYFRVFKSPIHIALNTIDFIHICLLRVFYYFPSRFSTDVSVFIPGKLSLEYPSLNLSSFWESLALKTWHALFITSLAAIPPRTDILACTSFPINRFPNELADNVPNSVVTDISFYLFASFLSMLRIDPFGATHEYGPKRAFPTMIKFSTVISCVKNRSKKYINHVTHIPNSAGINIFTLKISIFLY